MQLYFDLITGGFAAPPAGSAGYGAPQQGGLPYSSPGGAPQGQPGGLPYGAPGGMPQQHSPVPPNYAQSGVSYEI